MWCLIFVLITIWLPYNLLERFQSFQFVEGFCCLWACLFHKYQNNECWETFFGQPLPMTFRPKCCLGSWLCRSDAVLPPSSSHTACSPPPPHLSPPETSNLSHVLPCMWHGRHVIPFIQHSWSRIVLLKEALVWKTSHQLSSWLLPCVAFCPCRRVITELCKGLHSALVPTVLFLPIPHATLWTFHLHS